MNFFVVDDEVAICQGTCRRLQHFTSPDDVIRFAYTAEQALDILCNFSPDILITDIKMGTMTGLELIEKCRVTHPETAYIIITAFDNFSYAQQAIRLEVKDFLVKPYTESDLQIAVHNVLREKQEKQLHTQAYLEKLVYACVQSGGSISGIPFSPAFHSSVCMICWLPDNPPAQWKAGVFFADTQQRYLLVEGSNREIWEWTLNSPEHRFGVSEPGTELQNLYRQANTALEFAQLDAMPHCVFYQSEFEKNSSIRRNQIVLWAINYVSSHIGTAITMENICEEQHLNYSYFSKQFKLATGLPFSEYLQRRQMSWALEQLQHGQRVNEIAFTLGYSNPENFTKAFSRQYGASPRSYLNILLANTGRQKP